MCHIHNKSFIHEKFYPLITEYINLMYFSRKWNNDKSFLNRYGEKDNHEIL